MPEFIWLFDSYWQLFGGLSVFGKDKCVDGVVQMNIVKVVSKGDIGREGQWDYVSNNALPFRVISMKVGCLFLFLRKSLSFCLSG